ncbi:MAG TPA: hypothetical protein VH682_05175 [Gemmataceae bacterium]
MAEPASPSDCPLSVGQQMHNLIVYSTIIGLVFLGAPVLYVGNLHAALCEKLGESNRLSNLPSTAYQCALPLAVLVAWLFPYVRSLRLVLAVSYLLIAAMSALVVATLLLPSPEWVYPALVAHAAVLGCSLGVHGTFLWEILARGVAEGRRGQTLALAFGIGPLLAAGSSLGQQLVLTGRVGALQVPPLGFPTNFLAIFAASIPIAVAAAFLAMQFIVPLPATDVQRQPFLAGVFGGFGEYLSYRLILWAALGLILVYSGQLINTTLTLYTQVATGRPAADYAGYQNMLRFGCKIFAGFFLGWLLTRTNARAAMLATCGLCMAAVVWALVAPSEWFLLSFGLLGAGELFGIYYPNYILSCSPKSKIRRNMAFTNLMYLLPGAAPVLYGFIADRAGETYGKAVGFQLSFAAALAILASSFLIVLCTLTPRPHPRPEDMELSDKAAVALP